MVSGLLEADSVAVHLVNLKTKEPGLAHHVMNVAVISLLIGKACGCSEEELRCLGLGAMFHDVGKVDVPARVLRNPQRPPAEEQFYRAHVGYSIKHVSAIKDMPVAVRNIIACHHEHWDGSGFPNRLEGEKIPKLARIVAIANRYENLCNPFDLQTAMTPAEAMSAMYKKEGARFDPKILGVFVKAPKARHYDAVVLAVGHQQFKDLGAAAVRRYGRKNAVVYDIKYLFKADQVDGRL